MKDDSWDKPLDDYFDKQRSELSNFTLKFRYGIIKRQVEAGLRSDETLIKYINELEYRELKYENIRSN